MMTIKNGSLRWGTVIGFILLLTGAIAAHYNGKAESKIYTDKSVEKLEVKINQIERHVSTIGTDVAVIKTMVQTIQEDLKGK